MNIAFAGLRHGHIFVLLDMVKKHSGCTFAGAYEENAEARKAAEANGVDKWYDSLEELLADPTVDAVALGGCFADRGETAISVLRAKKHVIADKPLCTSLKQLDEIERLAAENDRKVTVMFTMRYEPRFEAVRELVKSGELGEVNNVYFGGQHPLQYGRRPMWYFEEGKHGGTINDIAIHGIDLLSFLFGLKNFTVEAARCWNRFASEQPAFKDSAQLMLTAENGAGILADVSYSIPDGIEFSLPLYWEFNIWGTGGVLELSLVKKAVFYKKGSKEPIILEDRDAGPDFLTDFIALTEGRSVRLTMEEAFESTRNTLMIQAAADTTKRN